jgi:hypothetical protein
MKSVEKQVWRQVEDQVRFQIYDQVEKQVWNQVRRQVEDQVWDQAENQVRNKVCLKRVPNHEIHQISDHN